MCKAFCWFCTYVWHRCNCTELLSRYCNLGVFLAQSQQILVMKVTLLYRELPKLVYTIVFCLWERRHSHFPCRFFSECSGKLCTHTQYNAFRVVLERTTCRDVTCVTWNVLWQRWWRVTDVHDLVRDTQLNFPAYRRVTEALMPAISCWTVIYTVQR
jgi:hypothetical protein